MKAKLIAMIDFGKMYEKTLDGATERNYPSMPKRHDNTFYHAPIWEKVEPFPRRLPQEGETWVKEPHPGYCRVGWSLGAGTHVIGGPGMDWGDWHHIEYGYLYRIK